MIDRDLKLCLHFTPFVALLSDAVKLSRYIIFLPGKMACFMQPIIISYPRCPRVFCSVQKLEGVEGLYSLEKALNFRG